MKIDFHYTYLILALGFVLTGHFSHLIVFTSILLIHELGHYLVAKLLHLNPLKITIYPFGGITKMSYPVNIPIIKELLVTISGITFQSIYYLIIYLLYKNNLIREYIFDEFTIYHYRILLFNILPIYPLDGALFLTILQEIIMPYKLAHQLTIIISIITGIYILSINYYKFNYTTILIITIIINDIVKYYHHLEYLFNKFLLERYLYKLTFKKTKKISRITHMYREKYHLFKEKNTYLTEKQVLNRRFNVKI